MASGSKGNASSYSAIVPIELLLAIGLPIAAVFLFDLPWVAPAIFLVASLPAVIALHAHRFLPVPRSAVLIGGVCYTLGAIASTLVTTGADLTQFAGPAISALLVLYFLFLLTMVPALREEHSGLVLLTIVLACGVNAGVNATLFLTGDPRATLSFDSRLVAVFGVPGGRWPTAVSAPYAVSLATAITLAALAAHGWWLRLLSALAAVPIAAALVMTETRGGVVGALAGVLAALVFMTRPARYVILGSLAAIVLLVLVLPGLFDLAALRGASYRADIWTSYLLWALEHPVFGQGLLANVHRMVLDVEFHHAHNLLISAWVRGGVLGVVGMAVMLGGGIYFAWRYARRFRNPVFLAMIVAATVAGMFDYELLFLPTGWTWAAFWLPIGLAAGTEIAVRRCRDASTPAARA